MPPDVRKSLPQLQAEWAACTRCDLGVRRLEVGGKFVFGEGTPRGVLFVGEGPGVEEEVNGRPFVGASGKLLRDVLAKIGLQEHYITNLVACRSCSLALDGNGDPIVRTRGFGKNARREPLYRDEPPTTPQWRACLARLHEEIYLVDPVLIVGLGNTASTALRATHTTITKDRGESFQIPIPGAAYVPALTEKKQEWARRRGGVTELPVRQNEVRYLFLPTFHPAYVLRKIADRGPDSPFRQFVADLRKAATIYERYMEYAFGVLPMVRSDDPCEEVLDAYQTHAPSD